MKLLQSIVSVLHLHRRWVRIMLLFSILAIIGMIFIPISTKPMVHNQIVLMRQDTVPIRQDSVRLAITNVRTNHRDTVTLYSASKSLDGASHFKFGGDTVKEIQHAKPAPPTKQLEEMTGQVFAEKKPFDWKGTITWGIGVLNGLVLVVLNVRNLILKKST